MAVIRCMKAALYRPDYQKFLKCPLIKRLGREFISKHAVEPLKRSAKLSKHFWGFKRKLKAWPRVLKAQPSVWKARPCVCIIIGPMLFQSATVATTVFLNSSFVTAGLHSIQKTFILTHPSTDKSKFTVRPTYTLMIRRFCKRSSVIEMSIIQVIKH